MPAKTLIRLVAGVLTQVAAVVTSAGAANDGDIPALDSTGKLDMSLMPVGVGAEVITATATEALSAGSFVNTYDVSGATRVRNADASVTGKEANGFVLAAVASGAQALVYYARLNTALTGLTNNTRYYLSATTPGAVTATPVSGAGKTHQFLGKSASTTSIVFEPSEPITLT